MSVVVDQLDIGRPGVGPDEADAPLVVDADAVLPGSTALPSFGAVTRWNPEVLEDIGRVEDEQLAVRRPLHVRAELRNSLPVEDPLGVVVRERPDHERDSNARQ